MTTRRELRDLLIEAGTRPTPRPDAEFVAALEERLLSSARPEAIADDEFTAAARKRTGRIPTLVAAAVAIAAVGVGVFVAVPAQPNDRHKVSLAASTDTVIELPDGTTVKGRDGLALPDGAIIRTGPDGHAEVGNVDLGPGQQAVVDGNRIVITIPAVTLPPVTIPPVTIPPVDGPSVPEL